MLSIERLGILKSVLFNTVQPKIENFLLGAFQQSPNQIDKFTV